MPKIHWRYSLLKIKNNNLITSKVTSLPGLILRTYKDDIYVQFLYLDRKDIRVKIKLSNYDKYINVTKQMKKYLDKKSLKYSNLN